MATRPRDILHELIDAREALTDETRSRLRAFLSSIDLRRLSDDNDQDYRAWVREHIAAILSAGSHGGYTSGAQATSRLTGATAQVPDPDDSGLLASTTLSFRAVVNNDVASFGAELNSYLRREEAAGTPPEQLFDQLEKKFSQPDNPAWVELMRRFDREAGVAVKVGEHVGTADETAASMYPDGSEGERVAAEAEMPGRWISVLDVRRCDTCEGRHEQVMTYQQFQELWGFSECDGNCRCTWVPLSTEPVGEPLRRSGGKRASEDT